MRGKAKVVLAAAWIAAISGSALIALAVAAMKTCEAIYGDPSLRFAAIVVGGTCLVVWLTICAEGVLSNAVGRKLESDEVRGSHRMLREDYDL